MIYTFFALILTLIHLYNKRKDKNEKLQYQNSVFEMRMYTKRKREDVKVFRELEAVNQYAHQKNYNNDILRYRNYLGEANQGTAKKVYDATYNPIRKAKGEVVTPDDAYTPLEKRFARYEQNEFELNICKLIASRGFYKDAAFRWNEAIRKKKVEVVTVEKETNSVKWTYEKLTSKNSQTSSAARG